MLRRDDALSFKLTPGLLFTRPVKGWGGAGELDTLNQMKAVGLSIAGEGIAPPAKPKAEGDEGAFITGEAAASSNSADENKKKQKTKKARSHYD